MAKIEFPEYLNKYLDPIRGFTSDEILKIVKSESKFKKSSNEYTDRPYGRDDWQLIYLSGGYGTFQYGDDVIKLGPSVLIVFKPYEPQKFAYYGHECPEVINYVHFSGTCAPALIKRFGFDNQPYYYMRPSGDGNIVSLFLKMQLQMLSYAENDHLYWGVFLELLTALSNNRLDKSQNIEVHNAGKYTDAMTQIMRDMQSNVSAKCQVKDYAEQLHLALQDLLMSLKALQVFPRLNIRIIFV